MYSSKFDNIADVLLLIYFKALFIGSFCLHFVYNYSPYLGAKAICAFIL